MDTFFRNIFQSQFFVKVSRRLCKFWGRSRLKSDLRKFCFQEELYFEDLKDPELKAVVVEDEDDDEDDIADDSRDKDYQDQDDLSGDEDGFKSEGNESEGAEKADLPIKQVST